MEADQPIISSSQDRFGRRHFADRIANVIASRESTSGLVLSLPPASRHARRALAIEGLDGALTIANYKLTEDEAQLLGEIFDKGFMNRMTTPRVAKRFGNALTFALPILIGETDIVDLILIEGIRIFIRNCMQRFEEMRTLSAPAQWIRLVGSATQIQKH
jgi:predicted KAP-like P-loop ATPase